MRRVGSKDAKDLRERPLGCTSSKEWTWKHELLLDRCVHVRWVGRRRNGAHAQKRCVQLYRSIRRDVFVCSSVCRACKCPEAFKGKDRFSFGDCVPFESFGQTAIKLPRPTSPSSDCPRFSPIALSKLVRHTMTCSSAPPEAKKSPAGEKFAQVVGPSWPCRV
jgi:hypothetical protein